MSKEFDPDEFLKATDIVAEEQAKEEQRKQEEAAKAAQQAANPGQGPVEPGMMDYVTKTAIPTAFGVGAAGLDLAGQALGNPIVQKGLELAGGGLAAKKFLVNPVLEALKPAAQAVGNQVQGVTSALNRQAAAAEATEAGVRQRAAQRAGGQVAQQATRAGFGPGTAMPTQPYQVPASGPVAPQGVPAQPAQQSMANRIRQIAAQRIAGFGASGAAVPAGVAAGGAAATGIAGGQMAAMTPEQRKAYYDNMMLGAMGGDAAMAAAIMNQGQ